MDRKKELFENTPVPKALATLAVPTIISQLITMIYNLADTYFIGLTDDPYKVASATLSFVLVFGMNALANLFGVGGGTLISRLLGKGKEGEAKKVSAFSFYGTIIITGLYSLICLLFPQTVLNMVGASANTYCYSYEYMLWVVIVGGIPATLSMSMAHMLRSEGYAKYASFGLGLGGVLNIILDPLFMFVFLPDGQEVTGAAMATCLSNVIALIFFLVVLAALKKKTVLSIKPKYFIPGFSYIREIFATGIPSALSALLACTSNLFLNNFASSYGDIELAALGIVKKIDMLPLNVGMGLCQGMIPLVAYNYASGDHKRMKKVISACRIAGMSFALICVFFFEIFAKQIVTVFIGDAQTVAYGEVFLRICCAATPIMFYNLLATFSLQAMGKGPESLLLSGCRQGLVNIPLLFLLNSLFGLYGVVSTQLVADSITMIISTTLTVIVFRKIKQEHPTE
ncbi:MAG: MATE family efflux transporter [Clostridia bacterium]|nr:MATE family efflux transporter [Clostridia bacterium]